MSISGHGWPHTDRCAQSTRGQIHKPHDWNVRINGSGYVGWCDGQPSTLSRVRRLLGAIIDNDHGMHTWADEARAILAEWDGQTDEHLNATCDGAQTTDAELIAAHRKSCAVCSSDRITQPSVEVFDTATFLADGGRTPGFHPSWRQ